MSVALTMNFTGDGRDTAALYDELNDKVDANENPPAGLLFHWCAKTAEGLRIVDVWESREAFDRFFAEKLGPGIAALQIPRPSVEELHVHNIIAPLSRK